MSLVGAGSTLIISLEFWIITSHSTVRLVVSTGLKHLHCMLLGQFALCAEVCEKLATRNVLHQEVQVARVLRESLKAHLRK